MAFGRYFAYVKGLMAIVNLDKKAAFGNLLQALSVQRDRFGLWLPLPFALGIMLYFALTFEPPVWMGGCFSAVLFLVMMTQRHRQINFYLCLIALLFSAGFTASQFRTWQVESPMLARETRGVTIQGEVREVDALPKALRVVIGDAVLVDGFLRQGQTLPQTVRVKLKNKDTAQPVAGDRVRLRSVLLPLSAPVAPAAFDFQRHAFYLGLGATGYAIGDLEIITKTDGGNFFENLRHAIRRKMDSGMDDKTISAIATAFLVGETKAIPEATWDVIRASGIAHLMAISGFHITVITGFFFFGLRALLATWPYAALRWPIKKISAALSVVAAILYLQLIGSPIPAERTVIMACVVMLAIMIDRDPFSLRLVAFAAFAVLLFRPEALMGPSFQMSFAAVIALIAFYESAAPKLQQRHEQGEEVIGYKLARYVWLYLLACLLTTLIATIATAPFTLFHFGRVPLWSSLVTNMVAVPVSSLITLPAGMLAIFLMPFGLEGTMVWLVEQSLKLMMAVAQETAGWHAAVLQVNAFAQWILGLCAFGGLWVCIWRGWLRWLGLLPVIIAAVLVVQTPRPDVLIADSGKLVLLRDTEDRIWLSNLKREKFVAEKWLEREGAKSTAKAAGDFKEAEREGIITCDAMGCLFQKNGKTILIAKSAEAVALDCETADIFIAPELRLDQSLCPSKSRQMIDKDSLRYSGAHALYLHKDGLTIESVKEHRGWRPWVPEYKRF